MPATQKYKKKKMLSNCAGSETNAHFIQVDKENDAAF